MYVGKSHPPCRQRGNQALHHGGGTTHIKLMLPVRQRLFEKRYIDFSRMVVIHTRCFNLSCIAINHVQVKLRGIGSQLLEYGFKGMFCAVANAVIQMYGAIGLML